MVLPQSSKILDELYSTGKRPFKPKPALEADETNHPGEETMVLHESDGKRISEALNIPELYIELDRAVWQVERALQAEKELRQEKTKLDSANLEKK